MGWLALMLLVVAGCAGACPPSSVYREPASWFASYRFEGETILLPSPAQACFVDAGAVPVPSEAGPLEVQAMVGRHSPAYVLAADGTAWAGLRDQPWFQAAYRQVQVWRSTYPEVTRLTLFERLPSATPLADAKPAPGAFATDAVVLRGTRLSSHVVTPNTPFVVTLHWDDVPGQDYRDLVTMVRITEESSGRHWYESEAGFAPSGLLAGSDSRLAQRFVYTPPDELPQGTYLVTVSLREQSGRPIPITASEPEVGTDLALGEVVHPPDVARVPIPMETSMDVHFGDVGGGVDLVGYDGPLARQAGDGVEVALLWQAKGGLPIDYTVFVHVLDADGSVVAQSDGVPVYGFYPTSQWQVGDYIRDEHTIVLPGDLARGQYAVAAGLYDPASADRLPARSAEGDLLAGDAAVLTMLDVR